MKKTMVLAGLCAVAVLGLSGCSKGKGLKSVNGYKECTATNSTGNVCMAFSKDECTSGMATALLEKELDLITTKKITKEDKVPACSIQDSKALEKKVGPNEQKRIKDKMNKEMKKQLQELTEDKK